MTGAPPPATPPILQATSVERRFGAARVLRGISLAVRPGECHLVVGPNGAGKSTLLRILSGLARPTGGTVTIGGMDPARDPGARRTVGLLSHQTHLYDDLTAVENLAFAGRLYGLADPAGAARERLAAFGLADRGAEPLRRLSAGMVQRVAIARALLHGPGIILLDEPFTGLDPLATERVTTLLAAQLAAGRAVVLVSHEVHEAWPLATHAHALVRGVWALSGAAEGGVDSFLHRYGESLRG
ncbi:MAG TPA: heme ABC exporter ATP-binding protein CcmA [Gemmatimonadales bacterium]